MIQISTTYTTCYPWHKGCRLVRHRERCRSKCRMPYTLPTTRKPPIRKDTCNQILPDIVALAMLLTYDISVSTIRTPAIAQAETEPKNATSQSVQKEWGISPSSSSKTMPAAEFSRIRKVRAPLYSKLRCYYDYYSTGAGSGRW